MKERNRPLKKIVWIFCEGKKTEFNYFTGCCIEFNKKFKNHKIKVKFLSPNITEDVIKTKIINKKTQIGIGEEDIIFLVFDCDEKIQEKIEKILSICNEEKIKIIFSNPCFEYWFLCHYGNFNQRETMKGVQKKLKDKFPTYEKKEIEMYEILKKKNLEAIKNAKKNSIGKKISINSNPYTNVYEIFDYLNSLKDF